MFHTKLALANMSAQKSAVRFDAKKAAFAVALMLGAAVVTAGTTGTEFQSLHTMLTGWANGYLGKALAVAAFLFGAGFGVAKQTILPAILGIVFALVFAIGPGVIDGMLTATI